MNNPTQKLWQPCETLIARSPMTIFQKSVEDATGKEFGNYQAFHQWSVNEPAAFWQAIWEFCGVEAATPYKSVVEDYDVFPGARWFPGSQLNFSQNLLKHRDEQLALVGLLENGDRRTFTYARLFDEVENLASAMRSHGIEKGDRIAGLMPNVPETIIAMLATASIGAIWSSCSPDFGVNGACDRFGQIEPRLLFTTDGYIYNGKEINCLEKVGEIKANINSIEKVIVFGLLSSTSDLEAGLQSSHEFIAGSPATPMTFEPLTFDHPLYIMYSSGTTGVPKCIVHGAGGTLIQHLKEHRLHVGLTREDTLFYFTTCGWMMWNWLVSGLACGATLVLFDGSPFAASPYSPNDNILLDTIDKEGITVFGTSAKYIAALEKQGHKPRETHSLETVRTILSTGSPLSHASYEYIYGDFKTDVHLASISGGTDIISCFILGNPNLPVYTGEIQCAGLGMAIEFRNDNETAKMGETGELVCARPFPSTPIGFWNDEGDVRFKAAYFDQRPGIWTHGDYGEVTEHDGIIIHGRSDAVLNPSGVRIGTAEIYRQVETLTEITDSIVVGQNWDDDERVVLFVVLQEGLILDDELAGRIRTTIRQNTTPRHVPAKIIAVTDIPRTISGKIVELAVRKVIHGEAVDNTDALANPEVLELYRNLVELAD